MRRIAHSYFVAENGKMEGHTTRAWRVEGREVLQNDCDQRRRPEEGEEWAPEVEDREVLRNDCDQATVLRVRLTTKWRTATSFGTIATTNSRTSPRGSTKWWRVARPSGTIATPRSPPAPRRLRWARHEPRRLRCDRAAPEEKPRDSWRVRPSRTIATSDAQGQRTSPPTCRGETAAGSPARL